MLSSSVTPVRIDAHGTPHVDRHSEILFCRQCCRRRAFGMHMSLLSIPLDYVSPRFLAHSDLVQILGQIERRFRGSSASLRSFGYADNKELLGPSIFLAHLESGLRVSVSRVAVQLRAPVSFVRRAALHQTPHVLVDMHVLSAKRRMRDVFVGFFVFRSRNRMDANLWYIF